MNVVGYQYDASVHCPDCTREYVSKIVVEQQGLSENLVDEILNGEYHGFTDSEGNPIHPIFDTDESGDTPESCDDCHAYIDTAWTESATEYALDMLRDYLIEGHGNKAYLDEIAEQMSYACYSTEMEVVVDLYNERRKHENRDK